jgi:hypothetical protein
MHSWLLSGFSCRDLVAVLVKYLENEAERQVVICSAYLPYDSEDPPPTKELKELMRYCEEEHLYLIIGCDSNVHHTVWGSTECNSRGEALMEFIGTSSLEILNQDREPTFCNGYRLEMIDITLGSMGLLENIGSWEVSGEPSLSDHRHILFTLRGSVPTCLSRNPWGSFREELKDVLSRGPVQCTGDEAGLGLALNWVQHAFTTAYEHNCPYRLVKPVRNSLRWTVRL